MKNLPVKLIFFGGIVLSFAAAVFAQVGEREKGIALFKKGDYANAVKTLKSAAKRSEAQLVRRADLVLSRTFIREER